MPTKREREYYRLGFIDGQRQTVRQGPTLESELGPLEFETEIGTYPIPRKPKRKLSAWQKFVKVNSKKPRFRWKSGRNKGKLNLAMMGRAYRKTPAGKKSKRR